MRDPYGKTPVPNSHQRLPGNSRFISLLAGLGVLALINGCFRGTEPAVYALCSPHGTANIYTVDANDTKVQCLVVKHERFLHTGTYGANRQEPHTLQTTNLSFPLAELQDKHHGIRARFLPPNAVVIPGITGY